MGDGRRPQPSEIGERWSNDGLCANLAADKPATARRGGSEAGSISVALAADYPLFTDTVPSQVTLESADAVKAMQAITSGALDKPQLAGWFWHYLTR